MSTKEHPPSEADLRDPRERALRIRYLVLTVAIFLPLFWSFITLRSFYPITSWTVMMSGGSLQRSWTYYLVRGETVSGEVIDLRPIELTDALTNRTWGLVTAAINNQSFKLNSPHPQNAQLIGIAGGAENIPRAARVPELLGAWGNIYNSKLPPSSPSRLKAVRIDVYRWDGGSYQNYDKFIETWRKEL
jgi:hypothetical protein